MKCKQYSRIAVALCVKIALKRLEMASLKV